MPTRPTVLHLLREVTALGERAISSDRVRLNEITADLGWGRLDPTWDDVVRHPMRTLRTIERAVATARRNAA